MDFKLYKVSGYEEAIMSLRMSKGKHYTWDKAREIQQLVYAVTNDQGFICGEREYKFKITSLAIAQEDGAEIFPAKITGNFEADVAEFKRLLTLTFNNAMKDQKHHTLMKYIDISFFSEGLHRGAQDDLDAHAMGFNNRITRFSTRLAEISDVEVSEWYQGKVIPFNRAIELINSEVRKKTDTVMPPYNNTEMHLPPYIADENDAIFKLTPFGYVLEKYSQVPAKNGLDKDVQRGLMNIGMPSQAIWKTDIFNLRYIYKMRNKLTKANPELKLGMEQLADQIEKYIPVFGEFFRKEYTDSGSWEHTSKVKTLTYKEFEEYKWLKRSK